VTDSKNPHGIEPDAETRAIDGQDQAPSVEGLFAEIARQLGADADGWGGINGAAGGLAKQRAEQQRAMKREANIFRDTFSTPAGRECLRIMTEMTIDAEPYPASAQLSIDAITPLVIAHDANCKFVRSIYQAIAAAENKEAKTRTVNHDDTGRGRRGRRK